MSLARLSRRVLCGTAALASVLGGAMAAADTRPVGCGTSRIGEITVATLRNAPIVTLIANGAPLTLLLDTGAEWTIVTPAAAKRIGAQTPRIEFDRQIRGLSGSLATNEVELRSFTAGDVALPWRRLRVASLNMPSVFSGPLDGVLGADTLSSFDVDLDLPHHRMVFYGKQSCASAAPAWAEPYATISARKTFSSHLSFPALLDGRQIDTFFDTGAQLSVLSSKAAVALGVTDAALSRDRATVTLGAAAERLNSHLHRFSHMEVGGEVVRNPELIVADVSLKDADLVLGIDFLASRRIWLSYGSQQIFLSRRT
ncbi:MAG TPA: retropepsin-like aspartic protease [Stellaceae bacterium]|nr:retropepsin-like aspartic protease [Stellaceae bacterium]